MTDYPPSTTPLTSLTLFPFSSIKQMLGAFAWHDTMPVACFGGEIPENYQPKYADTVYKIQVCCDALGRIVWFSGPHPGSRGDSTLWKKWGPRSFVGQELGLADGAYSGNYRLVAPFRKPPGKPLPPRKERYNVLHSFFRARIEHVFSRLWPFGLVKHIWRGKGTEGACQLQRRMTVLLHFLNFSLKRRLLYEPPGAWPLLPPGTQPVRVMVYPETVCEILTSSEEEEESPSSALTLTPSTRLGVWQPTMTRDAVNSVAAAMGLAPEELRRILSTDE